MNIPRELIYEDKRSLNDFCYRDEDSLNGQLYANGLIKIKDLKPGEKGFRDRLIGVFNDAYYICTMAVRLINSDISLHYYKERVRIPSVVLPMVYFLLSKLEPEISHIRTFLTILETDIKANGWEENLNELKGINTKKKCATSLFALRDLSPELLDKIQWWKVTDGFKTSEIVRVVKNFARSKEDYLLLLKAIIKSANDYEWEHNHNLSVFEGFDEDGYYYEEEKQIDFSHVYVYCEELKENYDRVMRTDRQMVEGEHQTTLRDSVGIRLKIFLKMDWFDELSYNRSLYTETWRDKMVNDFLASGFGNEIVEEWNKKRKTRTKRAQIKMHLVGALEKAGVFGNFRKREIAEKIIDSCLEMDQIKINSLTEYMRKGDKYSEWMCQYVRETKAENPTETSN